MNTQRIEEIKKKIEVLEKEIERWEPDIDEYKNEFDEFLDEQDDIEICGLSYAPSFVLKEVDSIAYNCMLNDFVDSLNIEPDRSEIELLEEELEELEEIENE